MTAKTIDEIWSARAGFEEDRLQHILNKDRQSFARMEAEADSIVFTGGSSRRSEMPKYQRTPEAAAELPEDKK